jgi:hypothetical protein
MAELQIFSWDVAGCLVEINSRTGRLDSTIKMGNICDSFDSGGISLNR